MKKWLFGGISLLIVGVVVFCGAMAALGWDFERLDRATYEEATYAAPADEHITRVELDVSTYPVEITVGDTLTLDYWTSDDDDVTVAAENGVLRIHAGSHHKWWDAAWFHFGARKHVYKLVLPQGVDVVSSGANADITIRGFSGAFSLTGTNADVTCSDCNFTTFTLHGTNADVTLRNCTGDTAKIDSTNLDVEVQNGTFSSFTATGTNLDVDLTLTAPVIEVRGTNLDMYLLAAVERLTVVGTNLDADLRVRGVKAEYTIETHGSGLPREQTGTSADKSIYLKGTNSDVELKFVS